MSYKRILVPIDGSDTANAGLKEALKIAHSQGSRLRVLHVIDESALLNMPDAGFVIDTVIADLRRAGKAVIDKASKTLATKRIKAETAVVENLGRRVAVQIAADAKRWRADLIVIGTHGRRGVKRLLMASDAEAVVRNTTIPVLLVHAPKKAPAKTGSRAK